MEQPIGILYEHPQWFVPLFAELERRGIPFEHIHAESLVFDPADLTRHYSLVVNRMSPSAWTRGHDRALFSTLDYLAYLEQTGTPVLNGPGAYAVELSSSRTHPRSSASTRSSISSTSSRNARACSWRPRRPSKRAFHQYRGWAAM